MACVTFEDTCFTAGDTITIDWQYTENDGTPIDLTGVVAQMQLLENITDVTQSIDMTGGITDAESGSGTFSLTATQSQSLLPIVSGGESSKDYVSKIRFTDGDIVKSIAGLNVEIEQSGIR